MEKNISFITLGIITIFIILVIFMKRVADRNINAEISDPFKYTKIIPADYSNLLGGSHKALNFEGTIEGKFRSPISEFSYNKNAYLFIYKLSLQSDLTINQLIHEEHIDNHISYDYVYRTITNNDVSEIFYKASPLQKKTAIYLNIFGSHKTLAKNDTMACYYSLFRNFSLRYDQNEPQDIYGDVKNKSADCVPLELLFLKKKNNYYMVLMTSTSLISKLDPLELYNLFCKKSL